MKLISLLAKRPCDVRMKELLGQRLTRSRGKRVVEDDSQGSAKVSKNS